MPQSRHTRSLKPLGKELKLKMHLFQPPEFKFAEPEPSSLLRLSKVENNFDLSSDESEDEASCINQQVYHSMMQASQKVEEEAQEHRINQMLNSQISQLSLVRQQRQHPIFFRNPESDSEILHSQRRGIQSESKRPPARNTQPEPASLSPPANIKLLRFPRRELPSLMPQKAKAMVRISSLGSDLRFIPKAGF